MSVGGVRESDVLKADSTAQCHGTAAASLMIGILSPQNIEYMEWGKNTHKHKFRTKQLNKFKCVILKYYNNLVNLKSDKRLLVFANFLFITQLRIYVERVKTHNIIIYYIYKYIITYTHTHTHTHTSLAHAKKLVQTWLNYYTTTI